MVESSQEVFPAAEEEGNSEREGQYLAHNTSVEPSNLNKHKMTESSTTPPIKDGVVQSMLFRGDVASQAETDLRHVIELEGDCDRHD